MSELRRLRRGEGVCSKRGLFSGAYGISDQNVCLACTHTIHSSFLVMLNGV